MREKNFTDIYPKLPRLERTIIKLRSVELTLVLFYSEEIKRTVIDMVQATDRLRARVNKGSVERVPKSKGKVWEKSLPALVADGAISKDEKSEIVKLVDFRNDIGHRIDHLFSDLEMSRFLGNPLDKSFRDHFGIKDFKHGISDKMKIMLDKLSSITGKKHYVGTFRHDGWLMFSSTETVLLGEVSALRKKLPKLVQERNSAISQLNSEIRIARHILNRKLARRYFDFKYFRGRLTKRGEELCYLFFDAGLSPLTVAHIFEMKLPSVQERMVKWRSYGGINRERVDFDSIPAVLTPSGYDEYKT